MSISLMDPEGIVKVKQLRQMSIATGSRLVHIAGQVSWDADGQIVAVGDLAGQVEQSYLNVATALAGADATFDDVVKLVVYVVDWSFYKVEPFEEGIARAAEKLGLDLAKAPLSLIGISAGLVPELLVEVEAVAVLD